MLTERFNVPTYKLTDKGNKLSVGKEILTNLLRDEDLSQDALEFIKMTKDLKAWSYMVSYFEQFLSLPISKVETFENHRMLVAHPEWSILNTSRIAASEPSVQNINRDVSDIYSCPKGYGMVFSDSGQIEPRITYSEYIRDPLIFELIKAYDDAYFGLLHFIKLDPNEEAVLRADLSKLKTHEITDDLKAQRKTLKVLGLAGNYGSANLASVDPLLGPLYTRKVVEHPARKALEVNVRNNVRAGQEVFYGAFGTPVTPGETEKYAKGSSGWFEHLVRCGINNPIQTTASELMMFSIYNAKQVLTRDCHIGYYKHDEGLFYVPEDMVEELAPKLQGCMSYQVEGWLPIGSDLHIGTKESGNDTCLFG